MGYTAQVRQFTMACNDDLPARPQKMTKEGIAFIRQMVDDELDELMAAQTVAEQATRSLTPFTISAILPCGTASISTHFSILFTVQICKRW